MEKQRLKQFGPDALCCHIRQPFHFYKKKWTATCSVCGRVIESWITADRSTAWDDREDSSAENTAKFDDAYTNARRSQ